MPVSLDPTIVAQANPLAPTAPFVAGAATVQPEKDSNAEAQEQADVTAWQKRIEEARKFDENARTQYAIDRRYAHGDAGTSRVKVPIAGVYIDLLKAILYARDPDVDVLPAPQCEPPPMADVITIARKQIEGDPDLQQSAIAAGIAAATKSAGAQQAIAALPPDPKGLPAPPMPDPQQVGEQAAHAFIEQQVRSAAIALLAPYRQHQSDAKQFGKTLEIVVSHLWKKAALKAQAELAVGSGLTVGVGWIKATWQERTGDDPIIRGQINDLQDNLERLRMLQGELADGTAPNPDEQRAEIEQQIAGLQARVEVVIARGLAIDFYPPEDIQVAPGYLLAQYKDAPWVACRSFMAQDEALAKYPYIKDKISTAAQYYQRKPHDPNEVRDVGRIASVSAEDADSFTKSKGQTAGQGHVCLWEIWHRDANQVITIVEGVSCYATQPYPPNAATTRFYPFFGWAPIKVDGDRHPESLTKRSASMLEEYTRTRSNKSLHRARALPKTGFDATMFSPEEIAKLEASEVGEMVGIKPTKPGTPISEALVEIRYPAIDPALYETAEIRAELELIWGIQEAEASTIHTAKTATEAEIQKSGTDTRNSYKRDSLDAMLGELAQYTAEVAVQKLDMADAQSIAGPWAFWPPGMNVDTLAALVAVDIRAGSSGKPDTAAQQQAWAVSMPLLQNAIMQIGQLRGSSPADIADCMEELVAETLKRTGDRLDPDRFMPPPPSSSDAPMGGAGGAPAPLPGGPPEVPMRGPPMPMGGGGMPPLPAH